MIPSSAPGPRWSLSMASVGNKIFLIGGDTGSHEENAKNLIYVLDTANFSKRSLVFGSAWLVDIP
jgi:hypothetical protein